MPESSAWPTWIALALAVLALLLLLVLLLRRPADTTAPHVARLERELRDELGRQGQATRGDLGTFQQMLLAQSADAARTQNEQIDSFRGQLARTQAQQEAALRRLSDTLAEQLRLLSEANERRLRALQEGNEAKLEQMRAVVDEKLQATLEQRLNASFAQVAERLEAVHKGLGDMQKLAGEVGSLSRVLTNVKTRGIFGEVQLRALLEQVFTPAQYAQNVATVPGSSERVEFALRLPGREEGATVWLPIDAKFPREDYERLLDASERADAAAIEMYARAIEQRLKLEARSLQTKYLAPPQTTDFAILFLPAEGLYAEALRRPGLGELLQREHKVMLAGPTTLLALLNSLQMGFRTLALEKRSAEVWEVLGAVKTEFAKFGDVLAKTRKKLDEAGKALDDADRRTRAMTRQLRSVEAQPAERAAALLPGLGAAVDSGPDDDDAEPVRDTGG